MVSSLPSVGLPRFSFLSPASVTMRRAKHGHPESTLRVFLTKDTTCCRVTHLPGYQVGEWDWSGEIRQVFDTVHRGVSSN